MLAARRETHFAALQAYAARKSHARLPSGYVRGDIRLGSWVIAQRQAHRKDALASDRTRRLEALPGWTLNARSHQH